jgi:hypothetical protein
MGKKPRLLENGRKLLPVSNDLSSNYIQLSIIIMLLLMLLYTIITETERKTLESILRKSV